MKAPSLLHLLVIVLSIGAVRSAVAIPQSFGSVVTGPFLREQGVPAEDYFSDEESAWSSGTDLPGEWEPVPGRPHASRLKSKAPVFGLKASVIEVRRSKGGTLEEVAVQFAPADCKMTADELARSIQARLATYTGDKPTARKGGNVRYESAKLVFTLGSGKDGKKIVTFKRK